jgi:hypothetical protein
MPISGDFLIFGTAFGFCALLCVLLARWYVWPRVAALPREEALIVLLWPHTSRFLNLAAATVQQVDSRIPRAWTLEIAWGDFIAAVFALVAIVALRRRAAIAVPLTWWATIFGLADFANSLGQGTYLGVLDLPMRAVWYIAAGVVPLLITAHVLAIGVLRRPARE